MKISKHKSLYCVLMLTLMVLLGCTNFATASASMQGKMEQQSQVTPSVTPVNAVQKKHVTTTTPVIIQSINATHTSNTSTTVEHVNVTNGIKNSYSIETITAVASPSDRVPYEVLGLDNWKLTLPRSYDGDTTADEVYRDASKNHVPTNPSLKTYTDEFFYTTDNGVIFECPVAKNTPTTGNSKNTRTELREMPANDEEAGWSASGDTVRALEFSLRVLQTSSTRRLAFAQIHDYKQPHWDDLIRIQIESVKPNAGIGSFGKIYILGDMAEGLPAEGVPAQDLEDRTIVKDYRLGDWITVKVTFNNDTIKIYVDGKLKQTYTGARCPSNYFKAGVYNQSTDSTSTGKGVVEFRSLQVTNNF